ncbi:type-1 angiotensin II receptor-associated protein-like isoform X3 [Daphnia pulex]|uniref:type-1 angiotensin II receptor-associated protein-like isoform X3 n=1 Tax=Daphnia pulex TaxID=6669 RepID=UPI001EDED097|nr:type-1 angiotensin II receptor-associated protein-like isoform X3 [Daphnia pulex]
MQQSSTLLNSALKAIFFIHLVFTTWGLQSDWAPTSYFFYNLLFLMVLLWGLHQQESVQPIVMAFYFDIICFILDIVNVGVFFPSRSGSTSRRFSAGMAIVNMLLRPLTAFFLYKIMGERNALYGGSAYHDSALTEIFGNPDNRRGRYQDMGHVAAPSQELRAAAAASADELNTLQKV